MRVAPIAAALLLASTVAGFAQGGHVDLLAGPDRLQWGSAPAQYPAGAQVAVLSGNPFKNGPYVLRLKMPGGYQIPAHHHPTDENVTVLSGSFNAGIGDRLDRSKAQVFEPGGFARMPANVNHFAWATGETVVQVHGNGPFKIVYANPADDPSGK